MDKKLVTKVGNSCAGPQIHPRSTGHLDPVGVSWRLGDCRSRLASGIEFLEYREPMTRRSGRAVIRGKVVSGHMSR